MSNNERKIQFSGIQPTGALTLGSYLGAVRNWTNLVTEYNSIFCIVDMHSITIRIDPRVLKNNTLTQLAFYIASGLNPEDCILFIQSHVHEHAELAWVLNCYAMFGELSRMTQFKDKSTKNVDNINGGLFTYPVLMAADILLYGTHVVPVGDDQKQHVELCRDIAMRFNGLYGEIFTIPEPYIPKIGSRIMSLSNPLSKMSKSENDQGCVSLSDDDNTILRAFRRAVTDSEAIVRHDRQNKPGISNLIEIYSAATGLAISDIEESFSGKGYGDFKTAVGEAVCSLIRPIREEAHYLLKNKDYLESVYAGGAQKAGVLAEKTLAKVYKKIGFVKKPTN